MEGLLAFLCLVAFVALAGFAWGQAALWVENVRVDSLADKPCPRCGDLVGKEEANAAFDRADQYSKDHVFARTSSDGYSSAPVVCRNCDAQLLFWMATRTLVLREDS